MEWFPKTLCVSASTPAVIAKTLRHHLSADDLAELLRLLGGEPSPAPSAAKSPPKPKPKAVRMTDAERCEAIYQAYPRRTGKAAALKAIAKALGTVPYEDLLAAVSEYAKSPAGNRGTYTPHPATWFNREQWTDDRTEWHRDDSGRGGKAPRRIGPGERFDPDAEITSL